MTAEELKRALALKYKRCDDEDNGANDNSPCDHETYHCVDCGSRSTCDEDHDGECPNCSECSFRHPCERCGHNPECYHTWECDDCGSSEVEPSY